MSEQRKQPSRDELEQKTKEELQELARDRDVAVSGTKDEIIDRLTSSDDSRQRSSSSGATSFRSAMSHLRSEFESATGLPVEAVVALTSADEGWSAKVQVVEQRRVPPTADVIGIYEVSLDSEGQMTSLERSERAIRGRLGS